MSASERRPRRGSAHQQALAGWLFVLPVLVILGVFLFVPILMALWVSVSDWSGNGSPFSAGVNFVGAENYQAILGGKGLTGRDFGMAIRNNLYYVLLVVPLQTIVALFLAMMVTRTSLRAKGLFRTAFYFPSVTSSVAITVLWLFLFNATGAVNKALSWLGINGPNWYQDPRGVLGLLLEPLGVHETGAMAKPGFLGISAYQWLQGPSVAMFAFILMAIFTTSGTFMLLFVAALQNIGDETEEAGLVDGATAWQRFRHITLPILRPTLYTVVTLIIRGTGIFGNNIPVAWAFPIINFVWWIGIGHGASVAGRDGRARLSINDLSGIDQGPPCGRDGPPARRPGLPTTGK